MPQHVKASFCLKFNHINSISKFQVFFKKNDSMDRRVEGGLSRVRNNTGGVKVVSQKIWFVDIRRCHYWLSKTDSCKKAWGFF